MDVNYSLICAVREGRLEKARDLINSYGLSYSQAWSRGYVLLRDAVMNNHAAVAKLLLTSGCKVNSKNNNIKPSNTPLHFAVKNGDREIVKMILDKGADIDAKNEHGRTPLHNAIIIKKMKVIKLLLKHKADVNARDNVGTSPLHVATQEGHKEVVKVLLECGAKVDSKIKNDITPLHLGAQEGYHEIIKTILNFGANVDSRDVYGRTALHIASQAGHDKVVDTLLEYNSDINITTRNNHTPLDLTKAGLRSFYNNSGVCSCEVTVKTLKRHIVKMKTLNLFLSEQNLLSINICDEISDFQDECEEEIAFMKSEKINNHYISYYDILAKGTSSLAIYMRNENIVQVLKSDNYKTKFPIYASMIGSRFRKGMERKELLEQGNNIFHLLFNNFPELPYDCTEKILSYLSDEDLRILMDACKPLSISNTNTVI